MHERGYGADETPIPVSVNFLLAERRGTVQERPRAARVMLWMLAIGAVFFLGRPIVRAFVPARASANPLAYDPVTLEPKPPEGFFSKIAHAVFSPEINLAGEKDDRINVLLMGIGGPGHDGPYLTDTIILVSIKPSTRQVAMVGIPRDLSVDIPGRGQWKINHASAFGELEKPNWGGAKTTEVVEKLFDIHIPYYARVDFEAFKEIIDSVGGITVHVERSFVDTAYPKERGSFRTVAFTQGAQTMDGATALQYARSRHGSNGEGSDFARSRRQQKMLLALKDKIVSSNSLTNPMLVHRMTESLDTHMTTNMSFADMMAMIRFARGLHVDTIKTISLDTSPAGYLESATGPSGAFILVPKAGDFSGIRRVIAAIFDRETDAHVLLRQNDTPLQSQPKNAPTASIEVQNGTWRAGLAARVKKRLEEKGISVETVGNADKRPTAKSGIYLLDPQAPQTIVRALAETLALPIREIADGGITPTKGTDILVVIGEDFDE